MTIGPKKKISKRDSRVKHAKREVRNLRNMTNKFQVSKCSNCGSKKLAYRVCPTCGYYKGKQVITIKAKGKEKVVDA